jgi:hypothetical protein
MVRKKRQQIIKEVKDKNYVDVDSLPAPPPKCKTPECKTYVQQPDNFPKPFCDVCMFPNLSIDKRSEATHLWYIEQTKLALAKSS